MKNIKNIIFDLGGVIINLDVTKSFTALAALGDAENQMLNPNINLHGMQSVFDNYEIGEISSSEFRDYLRKDLISEANDEEIDKAWSAMLGEIPSERIELLKKIGQEKRIFLFSNTNEIHKTAFDDYINSAYEGLSLDDLFEKAYYSHLVGKRKPFKETFQWILEQNNLVAQETLFIDDTLIHVEGAKEAGIQAYHLQSPETILEIIDRLD